MKEAIFMIRIFAANVALGCLLSCWDPIVEPGGELRNNLPNDAVEALEMMGVSASDADVTAACEATSNVPDRLRPRCENAYYSLSSMALNNGEHKAAIDLIEAAERIWVKSSRLSVNLKMARKMYSRETVDDAMERSKDALERADVREAAAQIDRCKDALLQFSSAGGESSEKAKIQAQIAEQQKVLNKARLKEANDELVAASKESDPNQALAHGARASAAIYSFRAAGGDSTATSNFLKRLALIEKRAHSSLERLKAKEASGSQRNGRSSEVMVGPNGGIFHYSRTGKKVYHKQ